MAKHLYNVYAWHDHEPSFRVAEAVDIKEALFVQEAYLNRSPRWDAYVVSCEEDLGYDFDKVDD